MIVRIAIVNDMVLIVESLREIVLSVVDHEIAWVARNGVEAVQMLGIITMISSLWILR